MYKLFIRTKNETADECEVYVHFYDDDAEIISALNRCDCDELAELLGLDDNETVA